MATAMSLSSWIFVVRRSSFGSLVEPCLTSRTGTCQLKEPFLAMQKEIHGLTAVGAGQVLAENVARERWVTNEKEEAQEGVRARIVAKDFASGQSARSMGISSPTPSGHVGLKGGHLRFLGRSIFRRPGSSALYMQVDPTYLDEAFAEFDLKKGSTTFPDLRPILEQEGSQPLSAEGHARFRRVLGRLSWYCQTRQDFVDFCQHAWNWSGATV